MSGTPSWARHAPHRRGRLRPRGSHRRAWSQRRWSYLEPWRSARCLVTAVWTLAGRWPTVDTGLLAPGTQRHSLPAHDHDGDHDPAGMPSQPAMSWASMAAPSSGGLSGRRARRPAVGLPARRVLGVPLGSVPGPQEQGGGAGQQHPPMSHCRAGCRVIPATGRPPSISCRWTSVAPTLPRQHKPGTRECRQYPHYRGVTPPGPSDQGLGVPGPPTQSGVAAAVTR